MYKRYYDGYPSDTFAVNNEENNLSYDGKTEKIESEITDISDSESVQSATASFGKSGFFSSMQSDDVILIALLILLAAESPDDIVMPLIIGYLLLGDILPI